MFFFDLIQLIIFFLCLFVLFSNVYILDLDRLVPLLVCRSAGLLFALVIAAATSESWCKSTVKIDKESAVNLVNLAQESAKFDVTTYWYCYWGTGVVELFYFMFYQMVEMYFFG